MSKFALVKEKGTNGINYDVTTDDVIEKLQQWDSHYGIEISEVEHNRLVVTFQSLPENLEALAQDIYEFCPDVIEQGFGCMDDMVEMMAEAGQEIKPELAQLIEGVDFEQEDFGEVLLQRSLKSTHQVGLWWD
jgi:hypothetical protein